MEPDNGHYVDPNGNEMSEEHVHDHAKTRQISEGFVSWSRYGDHDHGEKWVEDKARWHKEDGLIDLDGAEDQAREKTAGAYIGKYISETYATLLNDEELDADSHDGKSALWKLAMYWATNRQLWSISRTIEEDIALDDQLDAEVRRAVHDCTKTSVLYHCNLADDGHACFPISILTTIAFARRFTTLSVEHSCRSTISGRSPTGIYQPLLNAECHSTSLRIQLLMTTLLLRWPRTEIAHHLLNLFGTIRDE